METSPVSTEEVKGDLLKKQEKLFEEQVMETAGLTFIALLALFGISYKYYFAQMPDFTEKYVWYVLYGILAVVANATAVYHLKAYRNAVTCMTGMMIGMTIGMISGLTFGYLIGATNGMFMGSFVGVLMGVSTGAWAGKCCGIMGVMEGAMAGLMGGTMGAMTSVMLIFDHINLFTPLVLSRLLSWLITKTSSLVF